MGLIAAALAAVAYAGASVLQSRGARGRGAELIRSPYYLTGLGLDAVGWVLTLVALRALPVYVVQAVLASSLAFTVVIAWLWLKAGLRSRDAAAIGALAVALAVIGFAGTEQPAPALTGPVTLTLTAAGILITALTAAALALPRRTTSPTPSLPRHTSSPTPFLTRPTSSPTPGLTRQTSPPTPSLTSGASSAAPGVPRRTSSAALAVLAGLAFSVTALAARAVQVRSPIWHTLAAPLPWVVAATGIAGTVAYAASLERGEVGPATALLWAVEVVVPAVVAIPLLGDGVRAGWAIPLIAAVAVVVATSAVLAGAPTAAVPEPGHQPVA